MEYYKPNNEIQIPFSGSVSEDIVASCMGVIPLAVGSGAKVLYREPLNEEYTYSVIGERIEPTKHLYRFRLDKKGGNPEVPPAQLAISYVENSGYFDITHRLVKTKNQGVSGTLFLHKMEDFLRKLMRSGILPKLPLRIEAGQESVIKWAQKNGFGLDQVSVQ